MTHLEEKLCYTFQDSSLLAMALRHSSYANEKKCSSYQRLEFLGDSILGMCVAEYLYEKYTQLPEGELTRKRASLVCEEALVQVAAHLSLENEVLLGGGLSVTGPKPSILADVVESILAAIYLDGGIEPARTAVHSLVLCNEEQVESKTNDYKSALQELVQQAGTVKVSYGILSSTGPDHKKIFTVEVKVDEVPCGRGSGYSKKEAEQQAAKVAIEEIKSKRKVKKKG